MLSRRLLAAGPALAAACLAGVLGFPSGALAATQHEQSATGAVPRFRMSDTTRLIKELLSAWQITKGQGVTVAMVGLRVDAPGSGLGGRLRVGPHFGSHGFGTTWGWTSLAMAIAGGGPTTSDTFRTQGLAPQVRLLDYPIGTGSDGVWQLWDAAAITDAVRQGAQVILVGEAGDDDSPHLDQAVAGAIAKGAVVIQDEWTSAGDPHGPAWPADLPGVIGAGGVTLPGLVPPYRSGYTAHTARGPSVVVAAPSNTFFQAGPQGVSWMWGSATADAWVVSTAALIKAVYPHLAPALVAQALALSANDHPAGGYNTTVGFGLINPAGALHEAATLSPLKTVAAAGPAVAAPGARLASGPAPGVVSAVRHGPWLLAGLGGAVVLGVVLIVVAVRLRNDRRRAPEVATYVWQ